MIGPSPFLGPVIWGDRGDGARAHKGLQVRPRQIDQREPFLRPRVNEVTILQLPQRHMELAFHGHQIVEDDQGAGARCADGISVEAVSQLESLSQVRQATVQGP